MGHMICRNCGQEIEEGVRFCPNCGQDQSPEAPLRSQVQPQVPPSAPASQQRNRDAWVWSGVKIGFGACVVLPLLILVGIVLINLILAFLMGLFGFSS